MNNAIKSREEIVTFARGFIGTPFKAGLAIKGVGCDCAGLLECVLNELGQQVPPRNTDFPSAINMVLNQTHLPQNGDVILFKSLRNSTDFHAGILCDGNSFIHAHWSRGVVINTYGNWFKARTIGFYSFKGIA